jgi:hypothetical protein
MDQIHLEEAILADLVVADQQTVEEMKVLHQLLLEVEINHQQTQELLMLLNMVIVGVLVEVALIVVAVEVVAPEELAPIVLLVNQQDLVGLEEQMTMLMDQQIQ